MVNENWNNGSSLEESIRTFTAAAKMWNKNVFGHILKRNIINRLNGTQRALERFQAKNLLKLEKVLWVKLERILDMEERLWRRRINEIKALRLLNGEWCCYDKDVLKAKVVHFFKKLYTIDATNMAQFSIQNIFSTLEPKLFDFIARISSCQKVHNALFDMAPLKAPGVDELHAQFYQSQLNIIGESFMSMVRKVFDGGSIESLFNKTLIVLIPKVSSLELIT
ncbi:reverse transcriptase [Gossypium australe]|uniref:Reverse transcriptase n=1 Tax=Gossypium australe TaxID=47621 RepID=A0A5B6V1H6_9ROSI|nr:reverse transcriptase [Gossypium australe]